MSGSGSPPKKTNPRRLIFDLTSVTREEIEEEEEKMEKEEKEKKGDDKDSDGRRKEKKITQAQCVDLRPFF